MAKQLTLSQRYHIAVLLSEGKMQKDIAEKIRTSQSTLTRELQRNGGRENYDPDQAHNAINRKLFAMKGFHQDSPHQKQYLNGFALLYNFVPYQRRAKNAGQCGVQVEKGHLPRDDWFLSLQILTAGGFR